MPLKGDTQIRVSRVEKNGNSKGSATACPALAVRNDPVSASKLAAAFVTMNDAASLRSKVTDRPSRSNAWRNGALRSEERRVGKEYRSRWSTDRRRKICKENSTKTKTVCR